jgi:acyl-CoA thioester hydrolase
MSEAKSRPTRDGYRYFLQVPTRWMDNDLYGHVNNVVYYSYVDTVVNRYLVDEGKLDIHNATVVGVVVDSQCSYYAAVAYPDMLSGGLRVARLGRSSVVYEVGIFKEQEAEAVAAARFVHVFVDRDSMKPVDMPAPIRAALERLVVTG